MNDDLPFQYANNNNLICFLKEESVVPDEKKENRLGEPYYITAMIKLVMYYDFSRPILVQCFINSFHSCAVE